MSKSISYQPTFEKLYIKLDQISYQILVLESDDKLFVLPEQPFLWQDDDQTSDVEILMYLKKMPETHQRSVRSLVEKGRFRITLFNEIPQRIIAVLKAKYVNKIIEPIYIRNSSVRLYDESEDLILQEVFQEGNNRKITFDVSIDKKQCRKIYRMLTFQQNIFSLQMDLTYFDPVLGKDADVCTTISLQQILKNQMNKFNEDEVVVFKYFNHKLECYENLPDLLRTKGAIPNTRNGAAAIQYLVGRNNHLISASAFIRPNPIAINPTIVRPNRLQFFDASFNRLNNNTTIRSLPVVENENSPLWKDRKSKNTYWYFPDFQILYPEGNLPVAQSPFTFSFEPKGIGMDGRVILLGEISIRIFKEKPASVLAAEKKLGNNASVKQVKLTATNYVLEIPFTDQRGVAQSSKIPSSEVNKINSTTTELVFRLNNDWIRAAYGAFSIENFQSTSPGLIITNSFSVYRKTKKENFQLAGNNKISRFVQLENAKPTYDEPIKIDSNTNQIFVNGGAVKFAPNMLRKKSSGGGPKPLPKLHDTRIKPFTTNHTFTIQAPLLHHVNLTKIQTLNNMHISRVVKSKMIPFLFSCNEYGNYYLKIDKTNNTTTAIGCSEPYRLGQVASNLYAKKAAFSTSSFDVWQSNQLNSRFLIIPKSYKITRKSGTNPEDPYKPCAILHTSVDALDTTNTIGLFDTFLEPDIPLFERKALIYQLKEQLNVEPELEYPSDIECEIEYTWPVFTSQATSVESIPIETGLQISIRLPIADLLLFIERLNAGLINGMARINLPDGTEMNASLNLRLDQIIGPWETGPISVEEINGKVKITNQAINGISISKIQVIKSGATQEEIHIGASLMNGQSVESPQLAPYEDLIIQYSEQPHSISSIEESQIYIEDVSRQINVFTNVDFEENNIRLIEVALKLEDASTKAAQTVLLSAENLNKEVFLGIPITKFSENQSILYRVKTIFKNITPTFETNWIFSPIGALLIVDHTHISA